MNTNDQTTLRRILIGNALFSGISGLLFLVISTSIARFLGIEKASLVILLIGVGLAGYAFLIYRNASREEISKSFVLTAIISDSTWVVLSILLLLTNRVLFTIAGKWVVGIVAAIVDVFATLQFIEWRKI
jgi:hypothetical protein